MYTLYIVHSQPFMISSKKAVLAALSVMSDQSILGSSGLTCTGTRNTNNVYSTRLPVSVYTHLNKLENNFILPFNTYGYNRLFSMRGCTNVYHFL